LKRIVHGLADGIYQQILKGKFDAAEEAIVKLQPDLDDLECPGELLDVDIASKLALDGGVRDGVLGDTDDETAPLLDGAIDGDLEISFEEMLSMELDKLDDDIPDAACGHPSIPAEPAAVDVDLAVDSLKRSRWGCFTITPRQAGSQSSGKYGGWQADCRFHALRPGSGCRKWFAIDGPTQRDRVNAVRRMLWWCCLAKDFKKQRDHIREPMPLEACPESDVILAMRPEHIPDNVRFDDDLDLEEMGLDPGDHPAVAAGADTALRLRGRGRGGRSIVRGGRGSGRGHAGLEASGKPKVEASAKKATAKAAVVRAGRGRRGGRGVGGCVYPIVAAVDVEPIDEVGPNSSDEDPPIADASVAAAIIGVAPLSHPDSSSDDSSSSSSSD
jgi:hypothetical protein